jgi:hypothetical protein
MGDDLRNEFEETLKHERGEALNDALDVLAELMPGHRVYTPEAIVTMRDHERKVTAELRTLREDRDKLRGFFEHLALTVWQFCDIDGGEFQDCAVEQGLLVSVPADEEFKAEFDCDVMYTWSWSSLAQKEPDADAS